MNGDPQARIAELEILLAQATGAGLNLNGQPATPEIAARITEVGTEEWLRRRGRQWADAKIAAQSWRQPTAREFPGTLADSLARAAPPGSAT